MKTAIISETVNGRHYVKNRVRFSEKTATATYPARIQGTLLASVLKMAIRAYVKAEAKPVCINYATNSGTFNVLFT